MKTSEELQKDLDVALLAIEALQREHTATVAGRDALRATCKRLLSEIGDRDAKISRLHQDLELQGRAIERSLEALHSTTPREPPRRTEVVGEAVIHR